MLNADQATAEGAVRQLVEHESIADDADYKEHLARIVADRSKHPSLREVSAYALGRAGSKAQEYVNVLEIAAVDPSPKFYGVRRASAEALGRIGRNTPDVVNALQTSAALNSNDSDKIQVNNIQVACMIALSRLDGPELGVKRLSEVLDKSDNVVLRRAAAFTIGQMGPDARAAVGSLQNALNDDDQPLREVSAWALGLIGPSAKTAASALIGIVKGAEVKNELPKTRQVAATALLHIGSDQPDVVEGLAKRLVIESDLDAKTAIAVALAGLSSGPLSGPEAGKAFFDALHSSQDRVLQQAACAGLSRVTAPNNPDIAILVSISKEEYPDLRIAAINAIGHIHQRPDKSVPALERALHDPFPTVQLAATDALGQFQVRDLGPYIGVALDALAEAAKNKQTQLPAIRAIGRLGDDLQGRFDGSVSRDDLSLDPHLRTTLQTLDNLPLPTTPNSDLGDSRKSLSQALLALHHKKLIQSMQEAWINHKNFVVGGFLAFLYGLWVGVLYLVLLRITPLRLIGWNEFLEHFGSVKVLGILAIPLRDFVLLNAFHHSRVLEAWVESNAESARVNLINQRIQGTREVFYPLPVEVNGQIFSELNAAALRILDRKKWLLRIIGEGGLGKTTLACQLALLAAESDKNRRLFPDRRMIPVILERSCSHDLFQDASHFKEVIRGALQDQIGDNKAIPRSLCDKLLNDGRIVVIIDGISEMATVPEKPIPLDPDFSISGLIITSRSESLWSEVAHTDVRPLRIDSDHLSPFLNAYLGSKNRMADTDLFDACRRLVVMVGNRSITPLLARMYAEQLIGAYAGQQRRLPESIPQLVLGYLSALNRERNADDPQHGKVHRAAEVTAWECCKGTFSAGYASRDQISDALAACQDLPSEILDYLEKRLRLIRTIPPEHTHIEFALDPLAEYLSGLWLVQVLREVKDWTAFLASVDRLENKSESIADFIAAVWDCCKNTPPHAFGGSPEILQELLNRSRLRVVGATAAAASGSS